MKGGEDVPDKYDGPSIFKKGQINRRKRNFSLKADAQEKEVKTENKDSLNLKNNHKQESKQLKSTPKTSNNKKEVQSYLNKPSQPEDNPKPKSGSNFRVTEVPSPMFGYNEKQKEQLQRQKSNKPTNRQWNYLYIKKRLTKDSSELLITEDFKTPHLEKQWDTLTENQSEKKNEDEFHSQTSYKKKDLHRTLSGIIEENLTRDSSDSHRTSKAFDKFKRND